MNHRVFISYAGAQRADAEAVCRLLEDGAIRCWMAPRDVMAGSDWVDGIPAAIEEAELVVVLASPVAQSTRWVDRELVWAADNGRPVLVVAIGDTEPSKRLAFLFGATQRSQLPVAPTPADLARVVSDVRTYLENPHRAQELVSKARPEAAPRPPDPFVDRVTISRPAYFILLIDHSQSMNLPMATGGLKAREAVAEVVNDFLYRLMETSRRAAGYGRYFDVSVLGYGLGPKHGDVVPRLPHGVTRLGSDELYNGWLDLIDVPSKQHVPGGGTKTIHLKRPLWVDQRPGVGKTVMAAAFRRAGELVHEWIAEHPDSLPPVVLNITDGVWTDETPMHAVRALEEQSTTVGPTLVFNCQIAVKSDAAKANHLLFPGHIPDSYPPKTRELLQLSSILPQSMRDEARDKGLVLDDDARGFVYNAPISRLVDFLQVGTRTRV